MTDTVSTARAYWETGDTVALLAYQDAMREAGFGETTIAAFVGYLKEQRLTHLESTMRTVCLEAGRYHCRYGDQQFIFQRAGICWHVNAIDADGVLQVTQHIALTLWACKQWIVQQERQRVEGTNQTGTP